MPAGEAHVEEACSARIFRPPQIALADVTLAALVQTY